MPAGLFRLLSLAMVALLLADCGISSGPGGYAGGRYRPSRPMYKVGAPYQINGVWYYPAVDYAYDESGIASWYGEQFDQRYTANGEIFDLNQLTAAHRTLPMPSVVEVTNLNNGRALQLRVNDRGPFARGRIIDVSRRAAQLLGFELDGTARVRVRILKDESLKVAELARRNGGDSRMLVAEAPGVATVETAGIEHLLPPAPVAPAPVATAAPPSAEPPGSLAPSTPVLPAHLPAASASLSGLVPRSPPPPAPPISAPPTPTSALPASSAPSAAAAMGSVPSPVLATALPPLPEKTYTVPVKAGARIFVQAGAFSVAENAQRVRSRIAALGSVEVQTASVRGVSLYRVRLGPVPTVEQAGRLLTRLVGSGYPEARIVVD